MHERFAVYLEWNGVFRVEKKLDLLPPASLRNEPLVPENLS
jgi:hypothetical protein